MDIDANGNVNQATLGLTPSQAASLNSAGYRMLVCNTNFCNGVSSDFPYSASVISACSIGSATATPSPTMPGLGGTSGSGSGTTCTAARPSRMSVPAPASGLSCYSLGSTLVNGQFEIIVTTGNAYCGVFYAPCTSSYSDMAARGDGSVYLGVNFPPGLDTVVFGCGASRSVQVGTTMYYPIGWYPGTIDASGSIAGVEATLTAARLASINNAGFRAYFCTTSLCNSVGADFTSSSSVAAACSGTSAASSTLSVGLIAGIAVAAVVRAPWRAPAPNWSARPPPPPAPLTPTPPLPHNPRPSPAGRPCSHPPCYMRVLLRRRRRVLRKGVWRRGQAPRKQSHHRGGYGQRGLQPQVEAREARGAEAAARELGRVARGRINNNPRCTGGTSK